MRFGVLIAGKEPLPKIVSLVRLAEDLGYESAWLVDSQLLCRELYVTLTACALGTSKIALGAGVTAPYTRHVSVTASAFASLNEIAKGRLLLGISTGNSVVTTIGARPARIRELEEYVDRLTGLLDNRPVKLEGGVEGKIGWMKSPSRIPICVAATGPRMTRAAARMSNSVMLSRGVTRPSLEAGLKLVAEGAREAGKSMEQMDVVSLVPVSVSEDRGLARAHVQRAVAATLKRTNPEEVSPDDRKAIAALVERFGGVPHSPSGPRPDAKIPDRLIDMYTLAGSPQEVRERAREMSKIPGISQTVLSLQTPEEGFPGVESVMRDFSEGVMAHLG